MAAFLSLKLGNEDLINLGWMIPYDCFLDAARLPGMGLSTAVEREGFPKPDIP